MATARSKSEPATSERILDAAERLVQLRGFNGFSYADVASELEITKASLHYHFRGKAELGEALIVRYADRFMDALAAIDEGPRDAHAKLAAYTGLYGSVLHEQRMCLCGMLAAEYQTLPDPMRDAVLAFFDRNEAWLAQLLEAGKQDGSLTFTGSPREAAPSIVSALEGALLVSRPYRDPARFELAAARLLADFSTATPESP
jgi:TetR/AcrR family transcriptional regulator, transcriptional repressor for nem operon